MKEEKKITYGEMCDFIAECWNKSKSNVKLTGTDIWNFHLVTQFPALYVPMMYDAAKIDLVGFLLSNNTCAKMFMTCIEKKEKAKLE